MKKMNSRTKIVLLIIIIIGIAYLIFLGIEYYLNLPVVVGCAEYAIDPITNEEYCEKEIIRVS